MIRLYFHPTQRVAFFVGETGLPYGSFPSTPAKVNERSEAKDNHATEFNAAIIVACSAAGLASSVGLALSGLRS
jgi:hypothetical protein